MIKLNLGSGNKRAKGFLSIDGQEGLDIDGMCNLAKVPYEIKPLEGKEFLFESISDEVQDGLRRMRSESVDEIIAIEMLEHLPMRETESVLMEWYRIMTHDAKLYIQVPDAGKAMEYYANNEVCECVPIAVKKKPEDDISFVTDNYKPDPKCFVCQGKGKINPQRWLFTFTGAQKHKYDAHLNIFTQDRLYTLLKKVGFNSIQFTDDIYKLKVNCIK